MPNLVWNMRIEIDDPHIYKSIEVNSGPDYGLGTIGLESPIFRRTKEI